MVSFSPFRENHLNFGNIRRLVLSCVDTSNDPCTDVSSKVSTHPFSLWSRVPSQLVRFGLNKAVFEGLSALCVHHRIRKFVPFTNSFWEVGISVGVCF